LGLVPEGPGLADVIAGQRELLSRLRAVVEAKDAEVAALRAELEASRERERRLELRLAELERRLAMDSSDSGTPSSKERIGAKERRRALRQESERERRKDRRRDGQPGHPGRGLARDTTAGVLDMRESEADRTTPLLDAWQAERAAAEISKNVSRAVSKNAVTGARMAGICTALPGRTTRGPGRWYPSARVRTRPRWSARSSCASPAE